MTNDSVHNFGTLPLTDAMEKVLQATRRLTTIEWAEQHFRLKDTHALPGLWRWSESPFWLEPALSLNNGFTNAVTCQACTQSGKTMIGNAWFATCVSEDPGTFLDVLPRTEDFKKRMKEDILPILQLPLVAEHLMPRDAVRINGVDFDTMSLYLGSSRSPEDLSGLRARYTRADEVKSFDAGSGKLGNPISLMRERSRTFFNAVSMVVSSPGLEGDILQSEFEAGDQSEYWVPCKHCGEYMELTWDTVRLAKRKNGHLLFHSKYADGRRSRIICGACGCEWSDDNSNSDRWWSVQRGVWRPMAIVADEPTDEDIEFKEMSEAMAVDDEETDSDTETEKASEEIERLPLSDALFEERIEAWKRFRNDTPDDPTSDPHLRAETIDRLIADLHANYAAEHRSFRVTSLMVNPLFSRVRELAQKFARAREEQKNGMGIKQMQAFNNNELAQHWSEKALQMNEMAVQRHTSDGGFVPIPATVRAISVGVDVQKGGFYVVVTGWGDRYESWILYTAFVPAGRQEGDTFITDGLTKDARNYHVLDEFVENAWPIAGGGDPVPVGMMGLDSADGTRTYTIYEYCNNFGQPDRVVPLRGEHSIDKPPHIRATDLNSADLVNRRKKRKRQLRYQQGMVLYRFSPVFFKSKLHAWTAPDSSPGPGYMHFPANISATYTRQFCSQYLGYNPKTRKRQWRNRRGYSANHYFDATAMSVVVGYLLGVGHMTPKVKQVRLSDKQREAGN